MEEQHDNLLCYDGMPSSGLSGPGRDGRAVTDAFSAQERLVARVHV